MSELLQRTPGLPPVHSGNLPRSKLGIRDASGTQNLSGTPCYREDGETSPQTQGQGSSEPDQHPGTRSE